MTLLRGHFAMMIVLLRPGGPYDEVEAALEAVAR